MTFKTPYYENISVSKHFKAPIGVVGIRESLVCWKPACSEKEQLVDGASVRKFTEERHSTGITSPKYHQHHRIAEGATNLKPEAKQNHNLACRENGTKVYKAHVFVGKKKDRASEMAQCMKGFAAKA